MQLEFDLVATKTAMSRALRQFFLAAIAVCALISLYLQAPTSAPPRAAPPAQHPMPRLGIGEADAGEAHERDDDIAQARAAHSARLEAHRQRLARVLGGEAATPTPPLPATPTTTLTTTPTTTTTMMTTTVARRTTPTTVARRQPLTFADRVRTHRLFEHALLEHFGESEAVRGERAPQQLLVLSPGDSGQSLVDRLMS